MFKKILVPLDGSELAECVLPQVESMASGGEGPEVMFLHVIKRSELDYFDFTFEERKRAIKYLEKIVRRALDKDINAHYEILVGNPEERIPDYAAKIGADRIIMATHGRSGLGRWVYGSVADKVMRTSTVPVLMIRASDSVPETEAATSIKTINTRAAGLLKCR